MKSKQSPPAEADVINVILSADQGHAPFAAAVIRSVAFSANADDRLSFFVLTLGLPKPDEEKFAQLSKTLEVPIKVITAADDLVAGLPDKGRTKTAYLRMFAGDLLPEVKQVVYLDTDTLVRGSLSAMLYQVDQISGCAAVRDPATITGWSGLQNEVPKNFDQSKYFNSGVMVLSLDYLRKVNAAKALVKIREELKLSILHDQSAFNVFFKEKIYLIPFQYNYINQVYDRIVERGLPGSSQLLHCYDDPVIVHFSHYKKPWLRQFPQRFAIEYRKHLCATPWGADAMPRLTLRSWIGRLMRIPGYLAHKVRIHLIRRFQS